MYSVDNENNLISADIVNLMLDYCSLQPDIDETKVKAAAGVAQRVNLKRLLDKEYKTVIERCQEPQNEADDNLYKLIIPVWCYYTMSRLLTMFPGTVTDAGLHMDKEATDAKEAKALAIVYDGIAESHMTDVFDFLKEEKPNNETKPENLTPRIRVFGGVESWEYPDHK